MALHQILCIYITVSSLGHLHDSWVCEQVDFRYICPFLSSFPSVGLPCPIQADILCFVLLLCFMFNVLLENKKNFKFDTHYY